jgi:hypothetical protein
MITFDSRAWEQTFISNQHDAAWRCGKCGTGTLRLIKKIGSYSYGISRILRCVNPKCGMGYRVLGKFKATYKGQEVHPHYFGADDFRLHPTQFLPELALFPFPTEMSKDIQLQIITSFNHLWYDLDACANKIRHALELIVTEKGGIGDKLHGRIRSLKGKLGDNLIDNLLALKWIGNDGSHAGRPFERREILIAYSLFVDVLNQLFPDESEKVMRDNLVKLINAKGGIKQT